MKDELHSEADSLRAVKVSRRLPDYSSVCHLMKTAFPKMEQTPMWQLRMLALRKNVNFRAFYDEDKFCGILYTAENENYVFVLYLAVNNRIRSKGYGSRILGWMQQSTDKIIVLNVEVPDPTAVNSEQREKRIEFYRKSGITDTGYTFTDEGVTYSVLSSDNEKFDPDEYAALLKWFSLGSWRSKFSQK